MAITINGSGITSSEIADGTITNADVNDVAASKLTGALPAIDGASLTGLTDTFIVKRTSGNQAVNADSTTVIGFDTTVSDDNSFYNTSTYKFQPTKAGWWYLSASIRLQGTTDFDIYDVRILDDAGDVKINSSQSNIRYTSNTASGLMYFNGSTTYAQAVVYLGSAFDVRSNYPDTLFQGFFIKE